MLSTLAACGFGALLGMRHALEPDHLAAVSTLAADPRGRRQGFLLGALWGLGHSVALISVAGTLVLLGATMPARLSLGFEALVAFAVVLLGVRAVLQAYRLGKAGEARPHAHGERVHVHPGPPRHVHLSEVTLATRPLMMGLLHGLAGSGALTALALSRLEGTPARLLYVGLFAAGSVLGMSALTGSAVLGLERLRARARAEGALLGLAGAVAICVGSAWGLASVRELALS